MNVLDLFAGIGGFTIGLERAGMRTVGFSEIEPYCCTVLAKHWPSVPNFGDIREITVEKLYATGSISAGIDLVCGGFPCQDLSVAGNGAGLAGARSGLWSEFYRLIREIHPAYAVIENVSVLRSRGLETILGQLTEIGYDAEWHCIPAAALGAPHRRDRVWIVAYPECNRLRNDEQRPSDGWHVQTGGEAVPEHDGTTRSMAHADCGVLRVPELFASPAVGGPSGDQSDGCSEGGSGHRPSVADSVGHRRERLCQPCSRTRAPGPILTRGALARAHRTHREPGGCWHVEPDIRRILDGVPARTHRLRALGNSLVPQIAQLIGEEIMRHKRIG